MLLLGKRNKQTFRRLPKLILVFASLLSPTKKSKAASKSKAKSPGSTCVGNGRDLDDILTKPTCANVPVNAQL